MGVQKLINKIKALVVKVTSQGFFHIVLSSTLVKVIGMLSAMFLPRIITDKVDYGLLTYVDNIRNYILLINGLGMSLMTLRYCALNEPLEKKKGYFIFSIKVGAAFDIVLIFLSMVVFLFYPFKFDGANRLLLLSSVLPLFMFLFDDFQILFRTQLENQKYSFVSIVYSVLSLALQLVLAKLGGLNGVIMGRYLATILSLVVCIYFYKKIEISKVVPEHVQRKQYKKIFMFAITMLVANMTSSIMQLNEIFIIGQVLNDEVALADYRVASYILSISLFAVQSVIIFIYPYFVKHSDDKQWIWEKFKKVTFYNALVMIPLHVVLIIASPLIIKILFGESYLNVVGIMRVLLLASLSQSLIRGLVGNILAGIGEEKYNLVINVIFTIIHVMVDVAAVKIFGLGGAAIALFLVYTLSGILMVLHLRKVCKREEGVK